MEELSYVGNGERIDTRLVKQFPYSRNFFQHLIQGKHIQVRSGQRDRFPPKKSYTLQDGDQIRIESLTRFFDGGILAECPSLEIIPDWTSAKSLDQPFLGILQETEDYLVIYKPKGILSHPGSIRDVQTPSVVGGLYHYFEQVGLPSMGSFIRAGLLHRLDKETDGLMLIAKTEAGLAHFKTLFQQKSNAPTTPEKEEVPLKKYYRARCELTAAGKIFLEQIDGHFPYLIEEHVYAKLPHPQLPRVGITKIIDITPVADSPDHLFISLEILTGRTHQIRYHLSVHGLPIVGDYLYGTRSDQFPLQLTARQLVFEDKSGTIQTVSI